MDTQCVSTLPRVCGVLLESGSSLPDDTSLEKLLDWFTTIAQTGASLLEACPCLVDFVSKVAFNHASGSSILSFTLKLTGLIGASEDGFKVLKVRLTNPNSPPNLVLLFFIPPSLSLMCRSWVPESRHPACFSSLSGGSNNLFSMSVFF
uniref:BRCA1-associated ATM activator 1 n=1 Tax=Xiphophorus couchianus TaxID=32473 RepID=A0A3B5LT25_9TELE